MYDKLKKASYVYFFGIPNSRHMRLYSENLRKKLSVPFEIKTEYNFQKDHLHNLIKSLSNNEIKIVIIDSVNNQESIDYFSNFLSDSIIYCPLIEALAELNWALGYPTVKQDQDYVRARLSDYDFISKKFTDEKSKLVLFAKNNFSLTFDNLPVIQCANNEKDEYFNLDDKTASLLLRDNEVYIDIGAYNGDTILKFISLNNNYHHIHAFEPSKRNFESLLSTCINIDKITIYNVALGSAEKTVKFFESDFSLTGSRVVDNNFHKNYINLDCTNLDKFTIPATLIKMDVEGYEVEVLLGAKETIKRYKPNLAITCYHYPQDIFEIMNTVINIHMYKNIALRHYSTGINDYVLFFSDTQSFA